MNSPTMEYEEFSTKQLLDMLQTLESQCADDTVQQQERKTFIELLHEYNNLKDSTQIVLGALANMHHTTVREMHLKYNLPTNE